MGSTIKQNYTAVSKEILEYLFDCYLIEGGVKIYNITPIIFGHGFSLTEVGNYLVQKRLIKDFKFRPDSFWCSISIVGLKKTSQDWLDIQFLKIASLLIQTNNKKTSVMKILEFKLKDTQIALDIVKAFELSGYAQVMHPDSDIISLSSDGFTFYSNLLAKTSKPTIS